MHSRISAVINGKTIACEIRREDLPFFEARHGSAYALFRAISAGQWKHDDIVHVIEFATGPRPKKSDSVEIYALREQAFDNAGRNKRARFLTEAISMRGVGHYAPLAMTILAACLWGVSEEEASFQDEANDNVR